MNKRKKTSDIWLFFEKSGKDSAVCNICKSLLSLYIIGSSTNLKKHLQRKHPVVELGCSSNDQPASVVIDSNTPVILNEELSQPSISGRSTALVAVVAQTPTTILSNKKQTSLKAFVPKKVTLSEKNKTDSAIMKFIAWDFQPRQGI